MSVEREHRYISFTDYCQKVLKYLIKKESNTKIIHIYIKERKLDSIESNLTVKKLKYSIKERLPSDL